MAMIVKQMTTKELLGLMTHSEIGDEGEYRTTRYDGVASAEMIFLSKRCDGLILGMNVFGLEERVRGQGTRGDRFLETSRKADNN